MASIDLEPLRPLREQLDGHPIYGALESVEDLRVFMNHHVFSVWDFMSLVKYLQQEIAPTRVPWIPRGDPSLRYLINALVAEEESDAIPFGAEGIQYASHFEFYCRAMAEIGADADMPRQFVDLVAKHGVDEALYSPLVPLPARYFSETTFGFIRENKPHLAAAALVMGRETIIPGMFRHFLEQMRITPDLAPAFHAYLNRHILLDEDFHGPLSWQLLDRLCGDDPERIADAETAAEEAICARLRFWDGVLEAILAARQA